MDTNSGPNDESLASTPTDGDAADTELTPSNDTVETSSALVKGLSESSTDDAPPDEDPPLWTLGTLLPSSATLAKHLEAAARSRAQPDAIRTLPEAAALSDEAALPDEAALSPELQSVMRRIRFFGRTGDLGALRQAEILLRQVLSALPQ